MPMKDSNVDLHNVDVQNTILYVPYILMLKYQAWKMCIFGFPPVHWHV